MNIYTDTLQDLRNNRARSYGAASAYATIALAFIVCMGLAFALGSMLAYL